jgi:hypothetical protein
LAFGFFAWFASDFIAKSAKGEHTWGVIAGVLLIGLFVGAVIGFATQGNKKMIGAQAILILFNILNAFFDAYLIKKALKEEKPIAVKHWIILLCM